MAGRPSSMCRVLRSTPLHPGIVFGGTGQRWDLEMNTPLPGHDRASDARVDRAEWTQPLVISLADPRALFYASQFLYRSTDTAASWRSLVRSDVPRSRWIPHQLRSRSLWHRMGVRDPRIGGTVVQRGRSVEAGFRAASTRSTS